MTYFPFLLAAIQQGTKTETEGWYSILLWVGFFAIMYLFFLRPSMKQQKETKNLLDNLKAGDKVITSGGVWGEIETVEANRVRLKIADKVKITVSRNAINGFQANAAVTEKKLKIYIKSDFKTRFTWEQRKPKIFTP